MKKLVIIEPSYCNDEMNIHILNVTKNQIIDNLYIKSLGFDSNRCEWFIGNSVHIYNGQ